MIISSASDYREAARRKLPRFLFDYIDGGAYAEHTSPGRLQGQTSFLLIHPGVFGHQQAQSPGS